MKKIMMLACVMLVNYLTAQNVVSVTKNPQSERIPPLVGFNSALNNAPDLSDLDFVSAIQKLQPQVLRYPGGSMGNYWDWETGSLINYDSLYFYLQKNGVLNPVTNEALSFEDLELAIYTGKPNYESPKNGLWDNWWNFSRNKSFSYTPAKFAQLISMCDAEPIIQLNMLTSTVDKQIELLSYFDSLGININKIELGNEFNHSNTGTDELFLKKFPTAHQYADSCVMWMNEIWDSFPEITIGVVGGNQGGVGAYNYEERGHTWNEDIISVLEGQLTTNELSKVAFIMHHYTYLGNLPEGILCNDQETVPYAIDELKWLFGYPQLVVKHHFGSWWQNFKYVLDKGYKLWITEFNIHEERGTEKIVSNTWAQALYNSLLMEQYLNYVSYNIENTDYHFNIEMFLSHNIGNYTNGITAPNFNALHLGPDDSGADMTANGLVMSLWSEVIEEASTVSQLNFEGANTAWILDYPSKNAGNFPHNLGGSFLGFKANKLHGFIADFDESEKVIIVNTSKESFSIAASDILSNNNIYLHESYTAHPSTATKGKRDIESHQSSISTCQSNDDITYNNNEINLTDVITILPYSINTFMEPCSKKVELYQASEITSTSAMLSWQGWVDNGGDYTVRYRKETENIWNNVSLTSSNTTSVLLTNLSSETSYIWEVSANCSLASSLAQSTFRTKGCMTPRDISVENVSKDKVQISWEQIELAELYEYVLIGADGSQIVEHTSTDEIIITIPELNAGPEYTFVVSAICNNIQSEISEPTTVILSTSDYCESYIFSPEVTVNGYLVHFNWDIEYEFPKNQMSTQLPGKSISHYDISYCIQGGEDTPQYFTASSDTSLILDLTDQAEGSYYWKIRARCFNGGTDEVDSLSFVIGESVFTQQRLALSNVLIYPNPTKEFLQVNYTLQEKESISIRLMNMQAQVVYKHNQALSNGNHQEQIDVSSFPQGMYVLQIIGEEWTSEEKIFIHK